MAGMLAERGNMLPDGKFYRWKPNTRIINGGYPGEDVGTIPAGATWNQTSASSGSSPFKCYYRDSTNAAANCVSTRVVISGRDNWTASVDNNNVLTITVNTVIDSIIRDDKIETCGTIPPRQDNLWDVRIELKRYEGGPSIKDTGNIYIGALGTIATNWDLGSYTFSLNPGENLERGSVLVQNWAAYYYGDGNPAHYDLIWVGIAFENNMPKDYRPGQTYRNGVWLSHNRSAGAVNIRNNGSWITERTQDGGSGTGNPPEIYTNGHFLNMRKIGQE